MSRSSDDAGSQTANAAAKPNNSLAATPPGSPAPAATEIPPRHRPFTFVAFIAGTTWPQASVAEPLAEAHEGFGGGTRAAVLLELFAHVAAGFRAAVEEHPRPPRRVVDGALAGGGGRGGGGLAFPMEAGRGRGPGRGSGWRGRSGLLRRARWKSSLELLPGHNR
jgi:hypothetical protein